MEKKLIYQKHGIPEFAAEEEPQVRECLLCWKKPPETLSTGDMTWKNHREVGWYSNALLSLEDGWIARFYLCANHQDAKSQTAAWRWAKTGDFAGQRE